MAEHQQLIAGRYEVQGLLDEGGMGEIYRAFDRNLACEVVIKMPRPASLAEPGFSERFAREIRSLVLLAHPHVVRILDVGRHDGRPFAVMPFLGGGNLRTRGIPAPPASLRDWLEPIAQALDFVHQRGFLHRDVKPPNILFDEHGQPYLSDFGIAKVLTSGPEQRSGTSLTETGNVIGTAAYLAPELIMGRKGADGRADQYALAMTVYEVLSGRLPFQGPTPAAVMVQQTVAKLPPLRSFAPELPEALADAVEKALKKDPKKRFDDCTGFSRAVLAAADGPAPCRPAQAPRTGKAPAPAPARTQAVAAPPRTQPRPTEVEKAAETPVPPPMEPPPLPPSKTRLAAAPRVEPPIVPQPKPPEPPRRSRRRLVLVGAFAALALVGGGAGGLAAFLSREPESAPPEKPPRASVKPARAIIIEPLADATVRAGESSRLDVRIRRQGWDGPVTLTCDRLPPGITAEPAALVEGASEGGIALTATAAAAAGSVVVRLRAEAGDRNVETAFALQVLPPSRLALRATAKDATLYLGDEPTALGFTLTREECGDQPVQLRLDDEPPDGVSADLSTAKLPPVANRFEVKVRAGLQAPVSSFTLPVRAELPGGRARVRAEVHLRIERPPVQLGRPDVKRDGEVVRVRVPVAANGYRGELKASVSVPAGLALADTPRLSEGHVLLSLRQQVGAKRETASARLVVQAGGVAMPGVSIPVPIQSDIVAALDGPAKPRHLLFTPDGKALLAAGMMRDATRGGEQFAVWSTRTWTWAYRSKPGTVLLDPAGRWALLRRRGEWDVWTMTGGARKPMTLGAEDSQHVISGDGERLAILAAVTQFNKKVNKGIRVEGAETATKEKTTALEIRVYDTGRWGVPTTYRDPTPDGRLAAVSGDGRRLVEGKPRGWRVVQPWPAEELYPLQGAEYEEVILSPDDRYVACRSQAGKVMVLEARGGRLLFQTPELGPRLAVRFVPGRRLLALTDRDGLTSLWDIEKGQRVRQLDGACVGPLVLTPSGLAHDGQTVWSLDTGEGLQLKAGRVLGVSRDGAKVLIGEKGAVSVVDRKTRKRLFDPVHTHRSDVVAAALSPDGRHLAAADESGLVQVVEVPADKAR
jgi:serine/threonine protein kinase